MNLHQQLSPEQLADLRQRVTENFNAQKSQQNRINYVNSCLKHGGNIGTIAENLLNTTDLITND